MQDVIQQIEPGNLRRQCCLLNTQALTHTLHYLHSECVRVWGCEGVSTSSAESEWSIHQIIRLRMLSLSIVTERSASSK